MDEEVFRRVGCKRDVEMVRAKYLDSIASKQSRLWTQINSLIATTQPKRYDQAIELLIDLRDLGQREGKEKQFQHKIVALRGNNSRKSSFLKRLQKAGF